MLIQILVDQVPPPDLSATTIISLFLTVVAGALGTGFFGTYILERHRSKEKRRDDERTRDDARRKSIDEMDKDIDQRVLARLAYQDSLLKDCMSSNENLRAQIYDLQIKIIKIESEKAIAETKVETIKIEMKVITAQARELSEKFNECEERDKSKTDAISNQQVIIRDLGVEVRSLSEAVIALEKRLSHGG